MQLSARVLGVSTVQQLTARAADAVLTIGADRFRRRDLSAAGCFNFIAARHLTAAIAAIGDVRSTRDLFQRIPPEALVVPGVGAISLAVLGAAFECKGVGGIAPLEAWMTRHRAVGARAFVTFDTLKAQEKKREAGEGRAAKQRRERTHARRNTAQSLRVARFTTRHRPPTGRDHAETSPSEDAT